MDLVFNEKSIEPLASDRCMALKRIECFLETFKNAHSSFSAIRFSEPYSNIFLYEDYSLEHYINDRNVPRTYATLLIGIRRYPFIEDNSEEADLYSEYNFYLHKNGEKIRCDGLAAAYLCETSGIGFYSEDFWNQIEHTITKSNGDDSVELKVFCLSHPSHPAEEKFRQWLETIQKIRLIQTHILPRDKVVNIRDDHGKNILLDFADRLCSNCYVVKVINSLPFNPHTKKFIRKCFPDGKIELILHWTDEGYGMVIQTTGRTLRKTQAISAILFSEYDE